MKRVIVIVLLSIVLIVMVVAYIKDRTTIELVSKLHILQQNEVVIKEQIKATEKVIETVDNLNSNQPINKLITALNVYKNEIKKNYVDLSFNKIKIYLNNEYLEIIEKDTDVSYRVFLKNNEITFATPSMLFYEKCDYIRHYRFEQNCLQVYYELINIDKHLLKLKTLQDSSQILWNKLKK